MRARVLLLLFRQTGCLLLECRLMTHNKKDRISEARNSLIQQSYKCLGSAFNFANPVTDIKNDTDWNADVCIYVCVCVCVCTCWSGVGHPPFHTCCLGKVTFVELCYVPKPLSTHTLLNLGLDEERVEFDNLTISYDICMHLQSSSVRHQAHTAVRQSSKLESRGQ